MNEEAVLTVRDKYAKLKSCEHVSQYIFSSVALDLLCRMLGMTRVGSVPCLIMQCGDTTLRESIEKGMSETEKLEALEQVSNHPEHDFKSCFRY